MKGKELMKWIEENKLEEGEVMVNDCVLYSKVTNVWEGEGLSNEPCGRIILEVEEEK